MILSFLGMSQKKEQLVNKRQLFRFVLKVSSVNFSFKPLREQEIIIDAFSKFLNSLTCSIQILCDNQLINPNDWLLKIHDEEYTQFLKKTINEKNIITKSFYIASSTMNEQESINSKKNIIKQIKRCGLTIEEVDYQEEIYIPKLSKDFVQINDTFYSTLIVENWPHSGEIGWLEDLYNLDKNISLSMFIHPSKKENAINFVGKRLAQLQSNETLKLIHDNEDGSEDEEINTAVNMRDELHKNDGKFFFVGYYVTIKSKDEQTLKRDINEVKTFLDGYMIETKRANFRQDDGYKCSQPLGIDFLRSKSMYTFTTTPLKSFFPFISSNIIDEGGILIGRNLLNNSLIFLNHFNYFSASMLVIGKTGSGKSYAVKSQILKLIKQGIEVTVLDLDQEFLNLPLDDNLIVKKFNSMSEYKAFLIKYWEDVVNDPHVPRFLVIDEFWEYMNDPETAHVIQQITKKGRKKWLGLCAITQEVDDLLNSEFARSIINNSSIKILLKMEYSESDKLKRTFGLSNSELSFLVNGDEGEGLLFAGTNHTQFKTIVSPKQHQLITTKPQELFDQKNNLRKG